MQKHSLISRLAPAKINLALHVTDQRQDGYHCLDMIVAFAQYGDRVSAGFAKEDSFSLSGRFCDQIPLSADNLVVKARDLFRQNTSQKLPPVSLHLEKNLPVAAGIGGGSADAAAAMIALNQLWQTNYSESELYDMGLKLGADVPMCLHSQIIGSPVRVSGIGEEIEILDDFISLHVVMVNDGTELSTPAVFTQLQNRHQAPLQSHIHADNFDDLITLLQNSRNDLYQPAHSIAPNIDKVLKIISDQNAAFSQMSGSGATCFGIFKSAKEAQQAAEAIKKLYPDWFVVATATFPSFNN